jgi:hypothetical protein
MTKPQSRLAARYPKPAVRDPVAEARKAYEAHLRSEGYAQGTIRVSSTSLARLFQRYQRGLKLGQNLRHHAARAVRWLETRPEHASITGWIKTQLPEAPEAPAFHERVSVDRLSREEWLRLREVVLQESSLQALAVKVLMCSTLRIYTLLDQQITTLTHALTAADEAFCHHVKLALRKLPPEKTLGELLTPLPGSRSPYVRVYNFVKRLSPHVGVEVTLNSISKTPPGIRQGKMT